MVVKTHRSVWWDVAETYLRATTIVYAYVVYANIVQGYIVPPLMVLSTHAGRCTELEAVGFRNSSRIRKYTTGSIFSI